MRLKDWERKEIIEAIESVFQKNCISLNRVTLYLYGSRTNDQKRGGDIDLLLQVPSSILPQVKEFKLQMNTAIQDHIDSQKIDILIVDTNSSNEPFSQIALEHAVLIKKW